MPRKRDDRTVWLMVFGPAVSYRHLFAVGLEDYDLRESITRMIIGVRTIEEQLRDALAEYPPETGYDLVVVPLKAGLQDKWAFAMRTDADARRCLVKARAVK